MASVKRPPVPAPRRDRWERATTGVLALVGVLFIVAYSIWALDPELEAGVRVPLVTFMLLAWLVFIVDLVVHVVLTPRGDRGRYLAMHPLLVLAAILPVFRALRVLLLVTELPVLQRHAGGAVRARFGITALLFATAFVYFVALATLVVERDAPGATIVNFGDAIWWACVTIATVGYGDTYPITALGRVYAVGLMAGGIAIVGTASAIVLSLLTDRIASIRRPNDRTTDR